ncbi:protein TOPAZ1 [Elgaria multicarinata webbii]|uniref:protein TOPAZ1 n=1 Tax=Elgaria multicarinata webbii TaxID=159646 RepID=UPI002FCCC4E8
MAVGCNFVVDIKLEEEEFLMKGHKSKKTVQSVGKQEHGDASRLTLQNKLASKFRKERTSTSLEVWSHKKDAVLEKNSTSSFLETEQKIQSCLKNANSLIREHRCTLVKSGHHKEVRNLTEKDESSVAGLESQKVTESLQKSNTCSASEGGPQQKTWYFRERTKPVWSEQKAFRNQNKRGRTKRKCISNLEPSILSLGVLKSKKRKRDIGCCKSQLQDSEKCARHPVKVRSSSVPHLSSDNLVEGTESLVKSSKLKLVKPREKKRKRENNSSGALTLSELQEDVEASKQKRKQLLTRVANLEENKKCRSTAEEGRHRMVTRAFLKSKTYKSGEKLSWKPEKIVREVPGCRQGIFKKQMAAEQMVDCAPTEDLLVTRVRGRRKKQSGGKDEIVASTELKKEIKISREQPPEVLSVQHGKLQETELSTSQNCNRQNLLEHIACLPISKSNEIESKDPVCPCFQKKAKVYCDVTSFHVTNIKCPQLLDIKVVENKAENSISVEHQDEKLKLLAVQNVFPCRVEKIPVVKLLDCCYIKALLKSTSVKTYKADCGSLHVVLGEGKIVSSSRSMGQNDLSSSPSITQARRSLPQKSILVEKVMCQNNNNSRCQNGKQLRETKRFSNLKKQSKRIKMSKDPEKSAVHTNNECGLQREDTATADSSTILEKLNFSETTSLSLLDHTPDFILEQPLQKPQYQLANLSSNEKVSEACLVTSDASGFEKSEVLKKHDLEVKSIEAQIGFGNEVRGNDFIVKTLFSEKITSCNKNIADCMKRGGKTPKGKTVGKVGRKLQLNTCQRAVPIFGKNVWPHESCARTSLWVRKNHVSDFEKDFLRTTDSVVNSGQVELYKPLTGTSKDFANNLMAHTTKLTNQSPTSESLLYVCKAPSAIDNENKFSSVDVEICEQYTSSNKIVKKSKMASNSLVKDAKNKGNITKRAISIDTQIGAFADNKKSKRNCQKTSVAKRELPLKTLITGNLSNFRIPLLKDKNELRKGEYIRSSERDNCNPLDILEDSIASVKKARAKEISSYVNSKNHFQFEQINSITILEEYADQLGSDVPDKLSKKKSVHNKNIRASHVNELESSTLKGSPGFLSTGYVKQMLDSSLAPETNDEGNCSNYSAEDKANFADVLKAYEDDVLVIDVIEDDPDLFGDTDEQEPANINSSIFLKEKLELGSESPYLPRSQHLKCYPRDKPIHDHGTLKSVTDAKISLTEVDEIKSESLSGISSVGGVIESSLEDGQVTETDDLAKSFDIDKKYKFSEKMLAVKEEEINVQGIAKIENAQYIDPVNRDHQLKLLLPANKATAPQQQDIAVKPWINDFRFSKKDPLLPSSYSKGYESWKVDKNAMTNLGLTYIPHGYCRSHFNTLNGCERASCWYSHFLASGNDKLCSEILKKYISIGEIVLLQRAVQIFTDYYKEGIPVVHLDSQMLNNLLTSLLQSCLLKELFHVVHTSILIKILPTADLLLKVFEHAASMKLRDVVPELIDISYKLVDAGMVLEYEHVGYITKLLNLLQVSSQEISTFLSKFQGRHFHKTSLCDFESAAAEFQHCKEKGDWAKLGTLYINVRRGCENVGDLEKYSLCIANILASSVKTQTPGIPFCEFATAVNADPRHNEADTTLLGRIGISVMFSYYKIQQWLQAKKVLDLLHALKIHFTFSKGLLGQERLASRCHIVNVAVEIFLKCGSLHGAIWILKESNWVINTLSWPCDRMDVLKRHNLLCTIASEYITKSQYGEAFEALQNLPGIQNSCDTLDVSQYRLLFNKLLSACLESKSLGISSTVVEFMFAKNIPVEFNLLRALITALGRSCLWLKARTHYKSALAVGCYPPLEGNLYRKLLLIPSYMSEVEMLLAIEIFLVSNASSVQSPGASNQILQIVLKRCEGNRVRNEDDYQSAVERLIQAARISSPKLFIKHLTVNVNMDQVYSLEYACALKWLKQNMKWAGKVWLF